jgi:hypothetical protein
VLLLLVLLLLLLLSELTREPDMCGLVIRDGFIGLLHMEGLPPGAASDR